MIRFRRKSGQSLPLFAIMMVFIIAMVGLSVDVGNTLSQERRMQNSANAAALIGMNTVVAANNGKTVTNAQVWESIRRSAAGNRVDNSGTDYIYYVDYIVDNNGTFTAIPLADWNGHTQYITPGSPPKNIVRIQVRMEHRVPAYFTRIVGWNDFNVNVPASACLGGYGIGVLPVGLPQNLLKTFNSKAYHIITDANGATLATTDTRWGKWDNMVGMSVTFPMQNGTTSTASGTLVPILKWSPTNKDYKAEMTFPGTLRDGFVEAATLDNNYPNTAPFNKLTLGDWISGDTSPASTFSASMTASLTTLKKDQTEFALPLYDRADVQPAFRAIRVGRFKLVNYNLTGSTPYIQVQYLGDRTYAPSECVEPPPDVTVPDTYTIQGTAMINRVWGERPLAKTTYDVVIVMDTSGSMDYDWNDRQSGALKGPARLIDARNSVTNFVRNWDVEGDPDARMSFVTFGGTAATTQVNWKSSGCPAPTVTNTTCLAPQKWKDIQSKATAMTASGYTPGALAFEQVETLLKDKRTPRSGQRYGQIVLFATDGVFNVCGNYTLPGVVSCPPKTLVQGDGTAPPGVNATQYYINNPAYNLVPGRPLWQAQQVASRIKSSGARIFVVALTPTCLPTVPTCFIPQGLPDMSSGATGYYYQANNSASMATIYDNIREKIVDEGCIPKEQANDIAPGATVVLKKPNNPTWSKTIKADANGFFSFGKLPAGQYTLSVSPSFAKVSLEDGKSRTYSRLINTRNPGEEGQASVNINPRRPNGAIFTNDVLMTMPFAANGGLENGCSAN